MAAGLDLVDQVTAADVDQGAIERATRMAEQIQAAQRFTVNALNFDMVGDVAAAYLLVRGTRAVCQRRCLLGQSRATACTPGPARVRLRIHDTYGGNGYDETDAGCLQHAAEEWTRWDHGGEVSIEVRGPAEAAGAVARLGGWIRAERVRTGRCIADAPAADGECVTVPAEDLGEWATEDDLIRNGLWVLEGPYGHLGAALAEAENWDYDEVEIAWCDHFAERLAVHGLVWDPATARDGHGGLVTLPAGMSPDQAATVWDAAHAEFGDWIAETVVEPAREGASQAPPDGIRPDTAPGVRWITYSTHTDDD